MVEHSCICALSLVAPYRTIHAMMLCRCISLQVLLFHGAAVDKQTKCARAEDKGVARSLAGRIAGIMHCCI